jgi:hypothetical protein
MDPGALAQAGESGDLKIDENSAKWAIEFVKITALRMERAVATRVGDSDHDRRCQNALSFVEKAADKGMTQSELNRASRAFRALEPNVQKAVVTALQDRGDVTVVEIRGTAARGKPRLALFASGFEPVAVVAEKPPRVS